MAPDSFFRLMKQLHVDVSPPAFLWEPYLTLAKVTFDLDIVSKVKINEI